MPEPINNPQVGLDLVEQLAVRGRLPLSVDEVIVPVYLVGQREATAAGTRWAVARAVILAGAAGTNAIVRIHNEDPAVRVEIRRMLFIVAGAGVNTTFLVGTNPGAPIGASITGAWMDRTLPGAPRLSIFADNTTLGVTIAPQLEYRIPSAQRTFETKFEPGEMVVGNLAGNAGWGVQADAAASAMRFAFTYTVTPIVRR